MEVNVNKWICLSKLEEVSAFIQTSICLKLLGHLGVTEPSATSTDTVYFGKYSDSPNPQLMSSKKKNLAFAMSVTL